MDYSFKVVIYFVRNIIYFCQSIQLYLNGSGFQSKSVNYASQRNSVKLIYKYYRHSVRAFLNMQNIVATLLLDPPVVISTTCKGYQLKKISFNIVIPFKGRVQFKK